MSVASHPSSRSAIPPSERSDLPPFVVRPIGIAAEGKRYVLITADMVSGEWAGPMILHLKLAKATYPLLVHAGGSSPYLPGDVSIYCEVPKGVSRKEVLERLRSAETISFTVYPRPTLD